MKSAKQEQFEKQIAQQPHLHPRMSERPFYSRRRFFQAVTAGFGGSYLAGRAFGQNSGVLSRGTPTLLNKARRVIYILLTGAPSHTDTFDLKVINGTTPASLKPEMIGDINWPTGLMPKLARNLPDMAVVRTMRAWALQHNLGQSWNQIGRSPTAALGDIAPNIGTIVSAEKWNERRPTDTFPIFLGLNANDMVGEGYMKTTFAPVRFSPATTGFPETANPDGQTRFENKYNLLYQLDSNLRINSPISGNMEDYDGFYREGKGMMFNPQVDAAFRFTAAEAAKYGNTGFGNSCLTAFKVLSADAGTRYVQIELGSWDHHQNIYQSTNLPRMTTQLDDGLSALMNDLKTSGMFKDTLIVMTGEFGRTVGPLTGQAGRDHYATHFSMFAGAGVKGGRALGSTNDNGAFIQDFAWARDRETRPEDIEATIYSALGINYTNIRYDDPFKRGFEYVPLGDQDVYGPINELWG